MLMNDVNGIWFANNEAILSHRIWHNDDILTEISEKMFHYSDVRMGTMGSQNTSLTVVYSTVYSGADQRKHQSSASLAFVRGIHRWPVNSMHKWPVTRKTFPFHYVIMRCACSPQSPLMYANTPFQNKKNINYLAWLSFIAMSFVKGVNCRQQINYVWPHLFTAFQRCVLTLKHLVFWGVFFCLFVFCIFNFFFKMSFHLLLSFSGSLAWKVRKFGLTWLKPRHGENPSSGFRGMCSVP